MAHEFCFKFSTVRGEERQRLIDEIRTRFSCKCTASLRARISALVAFHEAHPEYPVACLAEAGYVGRAALQNRITRPSRNKGLRFNHRSEVANAIQALADKDWQYRIRRPGLRWIANQLRQQGIKCSLPIISELLDDVVYTLAFDKHQ